MTCVLTSAAYVLNLPKEEIVKMVGHDGSEELWPGHIRGITIQEIQNKVLIPLGKIFGVIYHYEAIYRDDKIEDAKLINPADQDIIFHLLLKGQVALLTRKTHCVVWDKDHVVDNGERVSTLPDGWWNDVDVAYVVKEIGPWQEE